MSIALRLLLKMKPGALLEGCEANEHDRLCAHALCAIDELIKELLEVNEE